MTERGAAPKRLPDYLFESRRRYFLLTLGLRQACVTDLLALAAGVLGTLKLLLQGRRHEMVPGYLAGIWRHSVLRRGPNRMLATPLTPQLPAA